MPAFKYDSAFDSKKFDLSNHNITFEPYDDTSYTVFVRENSSWPPVDYSSHSSCSLSKNNGIRLVSNGYFLENLSKKFKFYNTEYDTLYINENGYITLGSGESAFVQNLLQNHFSKTRISAMFLNLTPSSDISDTESDIFIGTGNYGEKVITFQNILLNSLGCNIRIDFQIRLFLNDIMTQIIYIRMITTQKVRFSFPII